MATKKCDVEHCDEVLSEHARSETCSKCRASFGYWRKRSTKQILFRRSRLSVYQARINRMVKK